MNETTPKDILVGVTRTSLIKKGVVSVVESRNPGLYQKRIVLRACIRV
nr:hypothetical protein RKYZRHPG_RKYZRHPG_CDS_0007 [uncultured phage]